MTTRAILYDMLSAVLFGISTPAAKALWLNGPPGPCGIALLRRGSCVALIRRFVRPMLSIPGIERWR